ncbi:MAG: hypothetical protein ACYC1T_15280 [Sulfuricaulis sp.]
MKQQKLFTGRFDVCSRFPEYFSYQKKRRPEPDSQIIKIIYISVCATAHGIAYGTWGQ